MKAQLPFSNPLWAFLARKPLRSAQRGLSFVEVLMTVSALGVLGGVGYLGFADVDRGVRSTKMQSDIASLNEAVTMYLASGGDLTKASTPEAVLAKLKTRLSSADAAASMGVGSGSLIDHRLMTERQSIREAATSQPRVYWNSSNHQFEVKHGGVIGVKRFYLDHSRRDVPVVTESRDGVLIASTEGNWMWDYSEDWNSYGDGRTEPTIVVIDGSPENPEPTKPTDLNSAIVQVPGDTSAATDDSGNYPTDPSTNNGPDVTSTGDSNTNDSGAVTDVIIEGGVGADGVITPGVTPGSDRLQTPVVEPVGGGYLSTDFPMVVKVTNADDYDSVGTLSYKLDGDSWTNYTGGIEIGGSDHELEFKVEPLNKDIHEKSFVTSDYYYAVSDLFSGDSIVQFKEIGGGLKLYFFLAEDNTFLTHGNPFKAKNKNQPDVLIKAGESNTMKVMSVSFSDVLPGQQFKVGEVLYHNGTTFDDSHAEKASLLFDITFTSPDAVTDLKIPLKLINTDNRGGPDASADIVMIEKPDKTFEFELDDRKFLLTVEFVAVDDEGFSDGRSFYVYEGRTARGELRGSIRLKD